MSRREAPLTCHICTPRSAERYTANRTCMIADTGLPVLFKSIFTSPFGNASDFLEESTSCSSPRGRKAPLMQAMPSLDLSTSPSAIRAPRLSSDFAIQRPVARTSSSGQTGYRSADSSFRFQRTTTSARSAPSSIETGQHTNRTNLSSRIRLA